ncbi:MAG: hypothetical protein ACI4TF_10835, partial [Oliverpabstia sp.]
MKKKVVHLLLILSLIMLGCMYSNTLMAEETDSVEETINYTFEAPDRTYYLEGIDDALDYSGARVIWNDEKYGEQWYYYSEYDADSPFTFEGLDEIPKNEDGTFQKTTSPVTITVKFDESPVGTFEIQVLSVDEYRINIDDYFLKKTQFLSDETLDCTSEDSYFSANFYYGDEFICGINSYDEKWTKAGFSIDCTWPSGEKGLDVMEVGEATLLVSLGENAISNITVEVIESLEAVTKKEFTQTGPGVDYSIDVIPYDQSPKKDYYKLVIPEDGEYWMYGRSGSWFNVSAELWNDDLTFRKDYINLGSGNWYLQDENGYSRSNYGTKLDAGIYYLIVTDCNASEGNAVDFYYQKAGTLTNVEVTGADQVPKEYVVGTSVYSIDFSALTWTFTYEYEIEDGTTVEKKETMKGAGSYFSEGNPWDGLFWTCTESLSFSGWEPVFDQEGTMTLTVSYFIEGESKNSITFDVAIKPFADMVSYCRVTLSDVKTEYVQGLESQIDTNGIQVSYKMKNHTYGDSITPTYPAWNDYGFSIHCIWEDEEDTGMALSRSGNATVNIMLGDNIIKSYDISVNASLDAVISGTFEQPGVTYDVERAKGTPGYYYKLVIPEDGDYDFYLEDYRMDARWYDDPEIVIYTSDGEEMETIPLAKEYDWGRRDGSELNVAEDGWLTKVQDFEKGEYYVLFTDLPLSMDRQLTFRYENAKELESYTLSLSNDVRRNFAVGEYVSDWEEELDGVGVTLKYSNGDQETASVGSRKWDYYGFYYEITGILEDCGYIEEGNGTGKVSVFREISEDDIERVGSYQIYVKSFKELLDTSSLAIADEEFETEYIYGWYDEIPVYDLGIRYRFQGESEDRYISGYDKDQLNRYGFAIKCIWKDEAGEPFESFDIQKLPSAEIQIFFEEEVLKTIPITVVLDSAEEDNEKIKGVFSEPGKKYLFGDIRGKVYYQLNITESGIYDLFINDMTNDDDLETGAIYTSDFTEIASGESREELWWPDAHGRTGRIELETGTYYISFYLYELGGTASFSFEKAKQVSNYDITFPDTLKKYYREGENIDLNDLQTILTYEDDSTETYKGTGSYWRSLGFSYEIIGDVCEDDWYGGFKIGTGTVKIYYGSGDQKVECTSMDFEVKAMEDLAVDLAPGETTSLKMDGSCSYIFKIEEEDYYDFLLNPQRDQEYEMCLYKKPNNSVMRTIYYYEEEVSGEMEMAETVYLTPGTYYLDPYTYGTSKEADVLIRKSASSQIAGFSLDTSGVRTTYLAGYDQINYINVVDGLKVQVVYENGKEETISYGQNKWSMLFTTNYDLSGSSTELADTIQEGTYDVAVRGGGYEEKYQIKAYSLADYSLTGTLTELGRHKGTTTKVDKVLKYAFTAPETKTYYFYGVTEGDSDAMLWDSQGNQIAGSVDREKFSLSYDMTAGETYYLTTSFKKYDTVGDLEFVVNIAEQGTTHDHEYGEYVTVKEATCTEAGTKEKVCKYCDEKITENVPALGHEYGDYTTLYEPTCEEPGKEYCICTRCGERDEKELEALGHEFGGFVTDQEATETKAGSKSKHCSRCDVRTEVTILPMLESDYLKAETVAKEIADKTSDELTDEDINSCQEAVQAIVSSSSGDNNAAVLKKNINMDTIASLEIGYVTFNEKVEETKVSSSLDNNDQKVEVQGAALTVNKFLEELVSESEDTNATYQANLEVEPVLEEQKLQGTNAELAEKVSANTAYVLDIKLSIKEITSDTPVRENIQPAAPIRIRIPMPTVWADQPFDLYHYKDDGSSEKMDYSIVEDDSGNKMIEFVVTSLSYYSMEKQCEHLDLIIAGTVVEPTCTKPGWRWAQCDNCKKMIKQTLDPLNLKGHTEVADEAVEATCTTAGKTAGSHCSVCGEVIVAQETVKAKGHTEVVDEAVEATCTTTGKTEGKHCSVCHEVLVAQEEIPAGHTPVTDKAVEATCTTAGKTAGSHCSVCGETLVAQKTIPATAHKFGQWKQTKEADAITKGEETRSCALCGAKEVRSLETLKPYITLSAMTLPLQLKKSTGVLKVVDMQKGDAVVRFTSSNPKIVTVNAITGKLTGKKT